MVVFGRPFDWVFLTFSASFLSANFIGLAANTRAQPSQQREAQDSRTSEADFDAFLDTHPQIDAQLRSNPSLINDQKWLQDHPDVLAFFNHHPRAKKEIAGSPSFLIRREGRRASRDARERSANLRKEEIASFQEFLNFNPQISKQLSANPALIKDPRYLNEHPGLHAYLYDHPLVNEEPGLFVQRESQQNTAAKKGTQVQRVQVPEKLTDSRVPAYVATREQVAHDQRQAIESAQVRVQTERNAGRPSPLQASPASDETRSPSSQGQSITSNLVLTASEIAGFDQFLGEHKEVNKDLERNPERVKDTNYLKKHKDLQDYLNQHTGLREELTQHPTYFMNRRNRYELSVAQRTNYTRSSDSVNSASSMPRLSQMDLRATDRFLEKHKNIYKDLQKNPSRAADAQYLKKHKNFREFLEQNPDISAAMRHDPVQFMQNQHDRFEQMHQKM